VFKFYAWKFPDGRICDDCLDANTRTIEEYLTPPTRTTRAFMHYYDSGKLVEVNEKGEEIGNS
jgi:hypothetical protein